MEGAAVSFQELFTIQSIPADGWWALVPLMLMGVFSLLALVASPFKAGRFLGMSLLVTGCVLALLVLGLTSHNTPILILDGSIIIDRTAQVFSIIILVSGLATALMSLGFDRREHLHNEYYALLGLAMIGMMILVSTRDFVFLFIALELMSLAVYVLVAMRRESALAAEAGLKYFLLGGTASAVLLYGVTLVYGSTGSLNYQVIAGALQSQWANSLPILPIVGLGLIAIGFLFKIGAAPFHMWIPDVYMGAPTPVTGFMISAVKAAAIGAFLRFGTEVLGGPGLVQPGGAFSVIMSVLIVATLAVGSFAGLRQQNLKRLFAYSTIAHSGYLLLGFMALTVGKRPEAAEAITSYTLFYVVMNLGAFAVLTHLSTRNSDVLELKDLAGLGQRRPRTAFALSLFLLSMAGIPPTAGFFGKYYLFMSAISAGQLGLTLAAVVASVVSVVYYLRPLVYMYMREEGEDMLVLPSWTNAALVSFALFLTIFMGLVPSWFSRLLQ